MKRFSIETIEYYRVAISGLLIAFSVRILFEITSITLFGIALIVITIGFLLARSVTKHFGHHHSHAGDSAIDVIPVAVLLFANIAHPAVDGFSLGQTFQLVGVVPGILFALSVVLHEIIRQSALVEAFSISKINWKWVVGTALFGIVLGIGTSIFGSNFFHKYENIADFATLFSYSFVIGEFYFLKRDHSAKYTKRLLALGIIFGIFILLLTHAH